MQSSLGYIGLGGCWALLPKAMLEVSIKFSIAGDESAVLLCCLACSILCAKLTGSLAHHRTTIYTEHTNFISSK